MDGVSPADAEHVQRATAESLKTLFQGAPTFAVASLLVAGVGAGVFTAGLAAPAIGAAVGGTVFGLYGAAATSAGLRRPSAGAVWLPAAWGYWLGALRCSAAGGLLGVWASAQGRQPEPAQSLRRSFASLAVSYPRS